jgi:subfamily B ATP-binding cassette protein MsbA
MTSSSAESRPILRLYRYSLQHRLKLFIGMLMGMIGGGSMYAILEELRHLTNQALEFATGSWESLLATSVGVILFFLLKGLASYFSIYLINWVGFKVVEELRSECFAKLQKLQLRFYGKHNSGELISRVISDTTMVQHAVSGVVVDISQQPFLLLGSLVYMIRQDWMLAALSLVVFPICIAPVIIFGRKVRKYSRQSQEHMAGLSEVLQENVSGVRVVKSFGVEEQEQQKFDHENFKIFGRLIKIVLARNINQPLMELVSALGVVGLLIYAFKVEMTPGLLLTYIIAIGMLYHPVKMLSKVHMEIQKAMGSAERIFGLLDEPTDVIEPADPVPLDMPIEEIQFENVSFTYEEGPVLQGINLRIAPGEKVALVGSSGSGKSTLVSLVPRFYDATDGAVTINGINLKEVSFTDLRSKIALVTQDTFLFNDTIARNIAFGETNPDVDKVKEAARRAHADGFIGDMENGYQTVVGERGGRLSGGQKQRLAIARAIYRDAPILILDEATSALDTESERLVQSAINEVMEGRTSIVIAHRLSTIQHADRILVLEEGQIVEQGTHSQLLESGGVYRRLYDMQFQG